MKKTGKQFEEDFKKSVPKNMLILRLKDNTQNWARNDKIRFSQKQPCDYILFSGNLLLMLELKSHKGKSIPFSCIRENQIKELSMYQYCKNVNCGLIISFSELEETYYMTISQLNECIRKETRKSIGIDYLRENCVKIPQKRLISHYKYDIDYLLKNI